MNPATNPAPDEMIDDGYQHPRDPAEIWLARQWQDVLGFGVGIRENFFGVGGNSLDAARVIDAVLAEFGVQLPLNALAEYPTVERLATLVREQAVRQSGPLVPIQDGDGRRPPLFLVHPESGHVGPYFRLAHALGEEFAVYGIQAAGLYSDAEPRRTVPAMADAYLDIVRAVRPTGPYLLGGCGIGAAVGYEMAARLDDVMLLAAIDTELLEPPDTVTESWLRKPPGQWDLPRILANWQERDLVPLDVAPEFAGRSLLVRRANRDAVRDWRPSPYTGPLDIFGLAPAWALSATADQRTHECGTDGQLAELLCELLGLPAMSTGTFVTTAIRVVPVKFSGARSGSGPVTLGQGNVLRWAEDQTIFGAVQCQTLNVMPGRSLNDVMTAIGGLISRHESLRTLFWEGAPGEWAQHVAAAGELLVEVHEAAGRVDDTQALITRRLNAPFALDREWPVRAAVITSDGYPVRALLFLTHAAADFASLGIIARDFRRIMSGRTNQAPEAPALHPLDQARLEMSPMARSRAEAAVRYWETTLRGTPQCMLAVPGRPPAAGGSRMATLRSRAAALAVASVADRTHASQSVVILAAVATLLGLRTVNDRCQITALCANRFAPASRDYVGTIAQDALIAVDLTAGTFDGIVQATRAAALTAYYHSQYDAGILWKAIDRVSEDRGTDFHRDCVMNDLNGAAAPVQTASIGSLPDKGDAADAMRDTRLVWTDTEPRPVLFYIEVFGLTRHEVSLSVWAEPSRFPAPEVEDFLFAVERLLVAAGTRNIPAADIGELAGIGPVHRDGSWRRIDSCWIEMPAVQQLLDDVVASLPGVDVARVFCTGESLVAYVSAPGSVSADGSVSAPGDQITPRALHADCVKRLAGRPTAMAPAWYVICDRAPDDPVRLGSWRHLPVLAEGSGRTVEGSGRT